MKIIEQYEDAIEEQERTLKKTKEIIEHIDYIHERNKIGLPNLGRTCYYMPIYILYPNYFNSFKNNLETYIAIIHDHTGEYLNTLFRDGKRIFVCTIMANTPREAYAQCLKKVVDNFSTYGKEDPAYLGALTNIKLITEAEMVELLKKDISQREKQLKYLQETLQETLQEMEQEEKERKSHLIPCSELENKSATEINQLYNAGLIDLDA